MGLFTRQPDVLCIGSLSQDIFLPTGEGMVIDTPEDIRSERKLAFELGGKVRIEDRYENIGGVAANVAVGLSRIGLRTGACGCVGDDELGRWAAAELAKEKVDVSRLRRLSGIKTDLSAIVIDTASGERTIFHNRDASENLELHEELFSGFSTVFVSALNGEQWKDNLEIVLRAKERYGFRLVLVPGQHNVKDDRAFMLRFIGQADIAVMNRDEVIELFYEEGVSLTEPRALLERLHGVGLGTAAMTDGVHGAYASDGSEMLFAPVPESEKVAATDATGAGDAFASGFIGGILEGHELSQALAWGMANAKSVVTHYGTTPGLLSSNDLHDAAAAFTPNALR